MSCFGKNCIRHHPMKKEKILLITTIIALAAFYAKGLVGILRETTFSEYARLTPVSLLVSYLFLLIWQKDWSIQLVIMSLIILIGSFLIEVIGVTTGLIFGTYQYGANLGPKLIETPVIIGINWHMLILAIASICSRLKWHLLLKSCMGATIMLAYDLILEPVAPCFDFWSWEKNIAPFQNYVAWFIISFLLLLLFNTKRIKLKNKFATPLLTIQFLFFIALNIFLVK